MTAQAVERSKGKVVPELNPWNSGIRAPGFDSLANRARSMTLGLHISKTNFCVDNLHVVERVVDQTYLQPE